MTDLFVGFMWVLAGLLIMALGIMFLPPAGCLVTGGLGGMCFYFAFMFNSEF